MQTMLLSRAAVGMGKLDALFIFGLLPLANITTTSIGIRIPGLWEGNPAMAWCMTQFGSLWWLPKLALIAFAILTLRPIRSHWPLTALAGLTFVVVLNNFAQIGTLSAARSLLSGLLMQF
jgi:hypothetical protein